MEGQAHRAVNPVNLYLSRYGHPEQFLTKPPSSKLKLVVAVPCYNEPDLITSLSSLARCDQPAADVEVIVLLNQPADCSATIVENNSNTATQFHQWTTQLNLNWIKFHLVVKKDIPQHQAGVGLARKMAMDEAVRRLLWSNNEEEGIIIGFDADCTCDKNYFRAIEHHFDSNSKTDGCSIYFEHPLKGPLRDDIYQAIEQYELHLRYLVNGIKFSGFPFAFQTLGSSMAVRCPVYQNQGGMNRRKAGEDFHFLQKVISLGNYSNLTATRVIPSPRISDRVPFGTGKAMADWTNSESPSRDTYNPAIFNILKSLVASVPDLYGARNSEINEMLNRLPAPLSEYLRQLGFKKHLEEINRQSTNRKTFLNRFYRWFNALRVLKLVHHFRDHFHPNIEIRVAAQTLLEQLGLRLPDPVGSRDLLMKFREMDRSN